MAFAAAIPLIATGVSALAGMFGNKNRNQQRRGTATTTTAPTALAPEYNALQSAIMPSIMKRLSSSTDMTGYENAGIGKINRTFDLGKQSVSNDLTARGLGSSPIAGAAMQRHETGRIGQIAGFQNSLPMVQRQMQDDDLAAALQMLNFGRSTAGSTSTSNQMSEEGGPGALAGGLDNMASMLGFLIGQGAFSGQKKLPWQGVPYA